MSDSLSTYLHDHLAAAKFAVEMLEGLRDSHASAPLGEPATALLPEIEEDRNLLQGIADKVGHDATLKEAAAWVAEKVSRLKLGHSASGNFGTFEALETLALGILGKLALWRALKVASQSDPRLAGFDFDALATRAEAQHERAEALRLQAARTAFQHP